MWALSCGCAVQPLALVWGRSAAAVPLVVEWFAAGR